jgi:hypothetical protein
MAAKKRKRRIITRLFALLAPFRGYLNVFHPADSSVNDLFKRKDAKSQRRGAADAATKFPRPVQRAARRGAEGAEKIILPKMQSFLR